MRVIREAEIVSDHHLVLMKVNIGGKRNKLAVKERMTENKGREGEVSGQTGAPNVQNKASHDTGEEERVWEEFQGYVMDMVEVVCGRQKYQRLRDKK